MQISLTDFVDFVVSSGTPKLTKVKQLKQRGPYTPAFDFWKPLREGIISFHREGRSRRDALDNILLRVGDKKKATAYPPLIDRYKAFLGRKRLRWFDPPYDIWHEEDLEVRINPELGLYVNDDPYIMKLYFKADALSKRKVSMVMALLKEALHAQNPRHAHYAILDIPSGRLFSEREPRTDLMPLLRGEARSFATIWNNL